MKRTFLIGAIVLAIIGTIGYIVRPTTDTSSQNLPNPISSNDTSVLNDSNLANKPTETKNSTKGSYQDYDASKLASASGQRVIFFYAPWCFQCRQIDEDIKENGAPNGYTVFKADFDSNQKLRQELGITFRTAFIKVDAAGKPTDSEYIAYNEPTLAAVQRDYLK